MALRFFADHCLSLEIIQHLRKAGQEVLRLKDHLPVESPDRAVIAKARELDAIRLSLNGDFADVVTYPPPRFKGIVALQLRNHPELTGILMDRLTAYLSSHHSAKHYTGKLFVVEPHRIRIRSG
jgi:predicted nuclease of predicted toxin-antitoxin system